MDQPYQVLPPLSPEECAALKADISARGVLVPVEYDEDGHILDGFHRVQICEELDIDYPRVVRTGFTDEQKRVHAWTLNLMRRHLTREQKQAIAVTLRQEQWSQERIAQALGVSQGTISMWLVEFINSNKLTTATRITGKDGKRYPDRKTRQPSRPRLEQVENRGTAEPAASRIPDTPLPPEPSDAGMTRASTHLHPNMVRTRETVTPPPAMEPDTTEEAIARTPKASTEDAGSSPGPNSLSPRRDAPDYAAGHWLGLVGELYVALQKTDAPHDLVTISQSWSPQMRADYLHRFAYVIRRLQAMHEALERQVPHSAPVSQAEGIHHTEEASDEHAAVSETVVARQERGSGTNGRARDHRREVLERIKTLRAQQRSPGDIAAILNEEGVPTLSGKGRWDKKTVWRLLPTADGKSTARRRPRSRRSDRRGAQPSSPRKAKP